MEEKSEDSTKKTKKTKNKTKKEQNEGTLDIFSKSVLCNLLIHHNLCFTHSAQLITTHFGNFHFIQSQFFPICLFPKFKTKVSQSLAKYPELTKMRFCLILQN